MEWLGGACRSLSQDNDVKKQNCKAIVSNIGQ